MKENNIIENVLKENIKKLNAVFVFPTQMAADLWADRTTEICDTTAVAMERFVAWDDFKGKSITSKQENLTSIPSIMRDIFATNLIEKNKTNPILLKYIAPEYSQDSNGFAAWISSILPGLSLWKKYFDNLNMQPDEEDKDLLTLYNEYAQFLKEGKFFDPAWETPPFTEDGNEYFIFFPEILSDWQEYKNLLENSPSIKCINFPVKDLPDLSNENSLAECTLWDNSRTELKALAHKLQELHENGIDWQDIAVSVPDMDSYGPYISRELDLYEIPHIVRFAKPLDSTGAGNFFVQASQCVSTDFSFNSIRDLLLNIELPWKDKETINQVINFGKNNNCICSYTYKGTPVDVWEESFKSAPSETRAHEFFRALKHHLNILVKSATFKEIQNAWFTFRKNFFDMEKCSQEADKIISRCISELANLIDLEENYEQCRTSDPYTFFTSVLSDVKYLEQTDNLGVKILSYKTAACAPFAAHVVVDSSQSALSVIYKNLSFLREDKRKLLFSNQDDPNVTRNFIALYRMNSLCTEPVFLAAKKTFTGYSQTCAFLKEFDTTDKKNADLVPAFDDIYANEKNWFVNDRYEADKRFLKQITKASYDGLKSWLSVQSSDNNVSVNNDSEIKKAIESSPWFKDGKVSISATHLRKFFNCPRLWLENYIIAPAEPVNEAELMNPFAVGNLYHKIFELYFTQLRDRKIDIGTENGQLTEECQKILSEAVTDAIECERKHNNTPYGNSFLATQLIDSSKNQFYKHVKESLEAFSTIFEGCSVSKIEEKLEWEDADNNCILEGKIDLLLSDNSELYLIDFKTGSTPAVLYAPEQDVKGNPPNTSQNDQSDIDCELPDFQIPMYLYLLQKNGIETDNAAFFNIKSKDLVMVTGNPTESSDALTQRYKAYNPTSKKKAMPIEDFELTMNVFKTHYPVFAQSLRNLEFKVDDSKQDYDCCSSCDYRALCRRTFNVSRQK
ncbi:MAG: PD-(D/E)XK nuclease family protein [Treponema sp.]|nr:PD-(D/E)XK nuclease family protein [Treponema sp.]